MSWSNTAAHAEVGAEVEVDKRMVWACFEVRHLVETLVELVIGFFGGLLVCFLV